MNKSLSPPPPNALLREPLTPLKFCLLLADTPARLLKALALVGMTGYGAIQGEAVLIGGERLGCRVGPDQAKAAIFFGCDKAAESDPGQSFSPI